MTSARASFDQYARYAYLRRLRQDCYGEQPLRILDVGDPFGTIAALFPGDTKVSVDVYADSPPTEGHSPLIGSGAALPFADETFDLVACHDVVEHLPADRRNAVVAEMMRVSRGRCWSSRRSRTRKWPAVRRWSTATSPPGSGTACRRWTSITSTACRTWTR
jgi:SAM-dependent methyltransferase